MHFDSHGRRFGQIFGYLEVIGRDKYGVFPLRGKVLNVKGEDKNIAEKIADNAEITNLKKILGLQSDKKYTTTKDLRYGSIMLMTDQDEMVPIKGLSFQPVSITMA